jgi:hypothetical protein
MNNVTRFPIERTRQPGETPQAHQARQVLEKTMRIKKWDSQLLEELAVGSISIADLGVTDCPRINAAIAELDDAIAKLEALDAEQN